VAPYPETVVRIFTALGARALAGHAGAYLARRARPGPVAFPVAGPGWLPAIAADGKRYAARPGKTGSSRTCWPPRPLQQNRAHGLPSMAEEAEAAGPTAPCSVVVCRAGYTGTRGGPYAYQGAGRGLPRARRESRCATLIPTPACKSVPCRHDPGRYEDLPVLHITHQPDEAPGSRTVRQRVGGEIETVGVAPVPEDQRTQTPMQMFIVWLMASASATTPLIGLLLFHFGLTYMIAAIVVAFLIGFIPAGLFSEMGREVPLSALVVARRTFGWDGSLLFSVLFSVVNLGWFGLNTEVGASASLSSMESRDCFSHALRLTSTASFVRTSPP